MPIEHPKVNIPDELAGRALIGQPWRAGQQGGFNGGEK
jgi:hypothetical protein